MSKTPRLISIQYLRFVAALLVVIHHSYQAISLTGRHDIGNTFELGSCGVDIFFCISGFIMVWITDSRETAPIDFFLRRLFRVAPLYWLLTAVMALALFLSPSVFKTAHFDLAGVIASFLFIPWPHPTLLGAAPFLQVGWTLNYEFLFYSIFSIALFFSWRRRFEIATSLILIMEIFGVILVPSGARLQFVTCSILMEFSFGMLIAKLFLSNRLNLGLTSVALIAAGVSLLCLSASFPPSRLSEIRFIQWGGPAALLLAGTVGLESFRFREIAALRFFGDASYSIYLTHLFSLGVVRAAWGRLHLNMHISDVILLIAGVTFSLLVGALCYVFVERPITKIAQNLLKATTRPKPNSQVPV